ncbi:winged helix DNA-binding domain-containing protein [[Clostridium] symbiosum]|uniref:winged helix DNA-binding domain-containing protein n=1 Tax=Clostridium symbiosum TaxID=1512 RepID=UPI0025703B55|nr:winged helix DNA-binding domain-containing protein [[Clostridium] symbiosum]
MEKANCRMNHIKELDVTQIRMFRLHSHHLDREYGKSDLSDIAGACGLQNTPPGAWETALFNRIPDFSLADMEELLYRTKTLLQAWSLRGAPVVFPASEWDAFLTALTAKEDEPWIYTRGISAALDFLQMDFEELFLLLKRVISRLDDKIITGKSDLDQTLAGWMAPYLPGEKRVLWNRPSMYGDPDRQTVGGAAVSFLLRPCAFEGLVVFGERDGTSPTFTSRINWLGKTETAVENGAGESGASNGAAGKLVRKFLHCYGPATADMFAVWLGCSGKQARRMWNTVSDEMEAVTVSGKKAFILSSDRAEFLSPAPLQRELLLLGGHDPYLDQRDRLILQPEKTLHSRIWKLVTNPGAVVYRGEVIGVFTGKKKSKGLEMKISLWRDFQDRRKLTGLAGSYAAFRGQKLTNLDLEIL